MGTHIAHLLNAQTGQIEELDLSDTTDEEIDALPEATDSPLA